MKAFLTGHGRRLQNQGPTCKRGGGANHECPPPYLKIGPMGEGINGHLWTWKGKAEKLIMQVSWVS